MAQTNLAASLVQRSLVAEPAHSIHLGILLGVTDEGVAHVSFPGGHQSGARSVETVNRIVSRHQMAIDIHGLEARLQTTDDSLAAHLAVWAVTQSSNLSKAIAIIGADAGMKARILERVKLIQNGKVGATAITFQDAAEPANYDTFRTRELLTTLETELLEQQPLPLDSPAAVFKTTAASLHAGSPDTDSFCSNVAIFALTHRGQDMQIDLSGVTEISASAIGALLTARRLAQPGTVSLLNVSPEVQRKLSLMRINTLLQEG